MVYDGNRSYNPRLKFILLLHTSAKKGRYSGYIILMNSDIDVATGHHSFVVTCKWGVVWTKVWV